ncbi:hypothetical protein HPB50_009444 [Hyalomma asiaticum]|uniref:Uncharacterized protein n=1 Tax=Hyalomma asiaticum TaxID=266040 RepID=A0ACB7SUV6_HYAAI|nr:hypothetical protein HPB50_009444 [Hyalomma asiaticum]
MILPAARACPGASERCGDAAGDAVPRFFHRSAANLAQAAQRTHSPTADAPLPSSSVVHFLQQLGPLEPPARGKEDCVANPCGVNGMCSMLEPTRSLELHGTGAYTDARGSSAHRKPLLR